MMFNEWTDRRTPLLDRISDRLGFDGTERGNIKRHASARRVYRNGDIVRGNSHMGVPGKEQTLPHRRIDIPCNRLCRNGNAHWCFGDGIRVNEP